MARQSFTWNVTVNGAVRIIEFYPMTAFKQAKLLIDGEPAALDVSKAVFEGVDQPILTGGDKDIRIVSKGKFTDLAVDGVYLGSGEKYEPLPRITKVNWIFVVISLCAAFLGGLIPALCAFGGAGLGAFVALRKGLTNKTRIILGVVCMVVTWAAAVLLSVLFVWGVHEADKRTTETLGNKQYSITVRGSFKNDRDTDDLLDEGFTMVFAAYSDDVYAYAKTVTSSQLRLIYGVSWLTPRDYLHGMFGVPDSDVTVTESGVNCAVLHEDGYFYVISVVKRADSFWYTEIYGLEENAEKLIPEVLSWMDTITVKD